MINVCAIAEDCRYNFDQDMQEHLRHIQQNTSDNGEDMMRKT